MYNLNHSYFYVGRTQMTRLDLSQDITQLFVNAAMEGFTHYTERRKQDAEDLTISRAGTWLKGNYIDDAVAKAISRSEINIQRKFAGYSWEYLQFDYYDKAMQVMNSVIFKNYKTLKSSVQKKGNKLPDYLSNDAVGNIKILDRNKDVIRPTDETVQLELFPSTVSDNMRVVDIDNHHFYIVGYTLGNDKNISSLKLIMPNPNNNALVEVADWTRFIEDAPVQPNEDDLIILQSDKNIPEEQYDSNSTIEYQLVEDSEKQNKK